MDRCVINFYDTRKDKLSDKWKCRQLLEEPGEQAINLVKLG